MSSYYDQVSEAVNFIRQHVGHVPEQHRRAFLRAEDDRGDVVERLDQADPPDEILLSAGLEDVAPDVERDVGPALGAGGWREFGGLGDRNREEAHGRM